MKRPSYEKKPGIAWLLRLMVVGEGFEPPTLCL